MINRIWFAFKMARRHLKVLKAYRLDSALQMPTVLELKPESLKEKGIEILVLDFDGVLAAHGEIKPAPEIDRWLNNCIQTLGEGNVFILTNKPFLQRAAYLEKYFRGIQFIFPNKKKPYPDGILQILRQSGIDPQKLLVVDDRLLTGILAAILSNVQGCYITKPLLNLNKRPVQELFFITLRLLERLFILI